MKANEGFGSCSKLPAASDLEAGKFRSESSKRGHPLTEDPLTIRVQVANAPKRHTAMIAELPYPRGPRSQHNKAGRAAAR